MRLLLVLAAVFVVGCGGDSREGNDPVGPSEPTVAVVEVSPDTYTLTALGRDVTFSAIARDETGDVISGVTFTWSSSHPEVATIDAVSGLATALGNGTTTIRAATAQQSGVANLTVEAPPDVVGSWVGEFVAHMDYSTGLEIDRMCQGRIDILSQAGSTLVANAVYLGDPTSEYCPDTDDFWPMQGTVLPNGAISFWMNEYGGNDFCYISGGNAQFIGNVTSLELSVTGNIAMQCSVPDLEPYRVTITEVFTGAR